MRFRLTAQHADALVNRIADANPRSAGADRVERFVDLFRVAGELADNLHPAVEADNRGFSELA